MTHKVTLIYDRPELCKAGSVEILSGVMHHAAFSGKC